MRSLATHMDDTLGCGEPGIFLKARQFLEARGQSFVHGVMDVSQANDLSVRLTNGELYECARTHSNDACILGATPTPLSVGGDSGAPAQIGRVALAGHCEEAGHLCSFGPTGCLSELPPGK